MRKNVLLLLVVIALCFMTGCASEKWRENFDYEEEICESAELCTEDYELNCGFIELKKSELRVEYTSSEDAYKIYLREELIAAMGFPSGDSKIEMEKIEPAGKKIQKMVENSKEKVIQYVENSKILEDKETIIEFIKNLPVMVANFDDNSAAAIFDSSPEVGIYINRENTKIVCDWLIVHELVHAVSYVTHGETLNYEWAVSMLNEVITDIITASMKPKMTSGYISGYNSGYLYTYVLMDTIGTDKILKSYFTTWDDVKSETSVTELTYFVKLLNAYLYYRASELDEQMILLISKWRAQE